MIHCLVPCLFYVEWGLYKPNATEAERLNESKAVSCKKLSPRSFDLNTCENSKCYVKATQYSVHTCEGCLLKTDHSVGYALAWGGLVWETSDNVV